MVTFAHLEGYISRHRHILHSARNSMRTTVDYIRCRNHEPGSTITEKEIARAFPEVKMEVTKLLGKALPVQIEMGSVEQLCSSYKDGRVQVHPFVRQRDLPADLSHEYTHHLQEMDKLLCEGHARGVERMVSQAFQERHNHLGFLLIAYERTLDELDWAWSMIHSPQEWPQGMRKYGLGSAAFMVAEQLHGKEIYKDTLHGDTSFLTLQ